MYNNFNKNEKENRNPFPLKSNAILFRKIFRQKSKIRIRVKQFSITRTKLLKAKRNEINLHSKSKNQP